jgi:hypothetical protein
MQRRLLSSRLTRFPRNVLIFSSPSALKRRASGLVRFPGAGLDPGPKVARGSSARPNRQRRTTPPANVCLRAILWEEESRGRSLDQPAHKASASRAALAIALTLSLSCRPPMSVFWRRRRRGRRLSRFFAG